MKEKWPKTREGHVVLGWTINLKETGNFHEPSYLSSIIFNSLPPPPRPFQTKGFHRKYPIPYSKRTALNFNCKQGYIKIGLSGAVESGGLVNGESYN